MKTPGSILIATKLRPPVLGAASVVRSRLMARLHGILGCKITVIRAPAGFGKSTALAQWIDSTPHDTAAGWLSCDADDSEYGRFVRYFVAALHGADPAVGRHVPAMLNSSPVVPTDSVVTAIVNDMSRLTRPFVVILDDTHLIESSQVSAFVNTVLTYAPPAFHLVLMTRDEAPVNVARARVAGQLLELDERDLKFSLDDSEVLLNQVHGLGLSASEVIALQQRTEGWVAGLQMASLSLRRAGRREEFIGRFSGRDRDLAESLGGEVLDRQSDEIREFLLRTSVLDRFRADLCTAVTRLPDCERLVADVERASLFVVSLDDVNEWYRYHHLFAEFLRAELERREPRLVAALHARAAQWLETHGLMSDAVSHAISAGNVDEAAALVERCAMSSIKQGHLVVVREWLHRLPSDTYIDRPRLRLAEAWIDLHTSRPRNALANLQQAKLLIARSDAQGGLSGKDRSSILAEMRTLAAGAVSAADKSGLAVKLARKWIPTIPGDQPFFRGTIGNILGFSLYSLGRLPAAREACLRARKAHEIADSILGVAYSDLILGLVEKSAGELGSAHQLFARARDVARERLGEGSYAEAMVAIFEVELLYERNHLEAAERLLHEHRRIIEECGLVVHEMTSKLHHARLEAAHGDTERALAILEGAQRLGRRQRYRRLVTIALNEEVRILIGRGEVEPAELALDSQGVLPLPLQAVQSTLRPAAELEQFAIARVMIARGRPADALRLLAPLEKIIRDDGRHRRLVQLKALEAIAAFINGDALSTLSAAVDTVSLAQPQRMIRSLVDEGPMMRQVVDFACRKVPSWKSAGPIGDYVSELLDAFDASIGQATGTGPPSPRVAVPGLSHRENEIAALLATGQTNRQLAEILSISRDTVKWHLKNLFGKLGVGNRTQAVLRLQELGITATVPGPGASHPHGGLPERVGAGSRSLRSGGGSRTSQ